MKHEPSNHPEHPIHSMLSADRLAYFAVLAGIVVQIGTGFSGGRISEPAQGVWYLVAVPLVLMAVYTLLSGIVLRRKLAGLGDFGDVERRSRS